tara:strand:- start:540 stop:1298 length:759 start_codon:yes stop_codon:yes gene_type:complete
MKYITFTNKGSLDICKNMLLSARNVGIEKDITVYTLDEFSNQELSEFECELKSFDSGISEEYHSYGTREFKSLMTTKIKIILNELESEDNFVYMDCDIVFKHNPEELMKIADDSVRGEYDINIFFSNDSLVFESHGEPNELCAGFMNIKNIKGTKEFFTKIHELATLSIKNSNPDACDQIIMRTLLSQQMVPNFNYALYPCSFITNGHHYFSQRKTTGNECVIHCNFRMGTRDKINSMKDTDIWYLPEKVKV